MSYEHQQIEKIKKRTNGSKPNKPKVSRSSFVKAAPLFRLGSFKRARPRRAVQIGLYNTASARIHGQ